MTEPFAEHERADRRAVHGDRHLGVGVADAAEQILERAVERCVLRGVGGEHGTSRYNGVVGAYQASFDCTCEIDY